MSAPPPPPFAPPPPTTPPNVPGPGAKSHLLSPAAAAKTSFLAETTETDPTLIALNEEVAQLKEEIRKLEKAPTSKQASESMMKYMANESDLGKEPLTKPIDTNSRWAAAPVGGCCVIL